MKMTRFQALFVLWLRHEKFCGCSWRVLAARYLDRYNKLPNGNWAYMKGNQIDGMELEYMAFNTLVPADYLGENSLYDINLENIHPSFNIKRHL